jgi:integrase
MGLARPLPRVILRMRNPRARARRPDWHYLSLEEVETVVDTAWRLARARPILTGHALRAELAIYAGLRSGELHALARDDVRDDGTILVRMRPGLKRQKPRVAALVNGLDESPTLARFRAYARDRTGKPLWRSEYPAWAAWVCHALGPATGLQARIVPLCGEGAIRYRIHPHAFRAAFVTVCRRLPRRFGRAPLDWAAICELGGWESVDTVRRYYYAVDLPETLGAVRAALHGSPDPARTYRTGRARVRLRARAPGARTFDP